MNAGEFHLDRVIGRMLLAGNNRPVGRIEEFRAVQHGDYFDLTEFLIGSAGLMNRLNVGVRALFGKGRSGKIARWDQVDLSDPERPRLPCSVDELRESS